MHGESSNRSALACPASGPSNFYHYLSALLIVMCRPERSWAAGSQLIGRLDYRTSRSSSSCSHSLILSVNTTDSPVVFETSDCLRPATSPGRRQNSVTKSEFETGVTPAMLLTELVGMPAMNVGHHYYQKTLSHRPGPRRSLISRR